MASTVPASATAAYTDHYVEHESAIPANAGQKIKLFVRERKATLPAGSPRRPVLMLHGRSACALAGFDLQYKKYSWAEELAKAGYDVYVMEQQGSGLSTRPEMSDPHNVNPTVYTGPLGYAAQLNNSASDWGEVDKVIDFIIGRSGVGKVDLIGWSAAAQQLGPYAIQKYGKVRSLFLVAPIFPPNGRQSAPGTDFGAPVSLPVSTPAGAFGFPMTVGTKAGLDNAWKRDLGCPDQREAGMVDVVWKAMMEADPIGADWGGTVAGSPEGLNRIRNVYWWGWNKTTVPLHGVLGDKVPVCIVYGEHDTVINTSPSLGLLYFSTSELYQAIPGPKKLMFRLSCAGHQIVWERKAKLLHTMSEHWLKRGEIFGESTGSFYRDEDEVLTPME